MPCPLFFIQGSVLKGSLSPSKNENKLDKDFYCTLHKFVLIRFIQRNQGHRDSVMHEFHSNVNKVNKYQNHHKNKSFKDICVVNSSIRM